MSDGRVRTPSRAFVVAALAASLWVGAGCPDDVSGGAPCVVAADCASGSCNLDGTCAPVVPDASFPSGDGGSDSVLSADADAGSNADGTEGPDASGDGSTDGGSGVCSFGDDWVISRDEYPLAAGQQATYRVASDVTVDTGGDDVGNDLFAWNFSGAYSGDQDVLVEAQDPTQWWFNDTFPGATYVARLSSADDLIGVFQLTQDELLLLGVASSEDGLFKTELTYDPPVKVLQFPLAYGDTWSTTTTVTGLTDGVATLITESYDVEVDKKGEMVTPFSTFDTLRVATSLTRFVGAIPYTENQLSWVSECFGVVASARSQAYATQIDFGDAAELRRLAQ